MSVEESGGYHASRFLQVHLKRKSELPRFGSGLGITDIHGRNFNHESGKFIRYLEERSGYKKQFKSLTSTI